MSYSRWSDSVWYTYWTGSGDTRDDQVLQVCTVAYFTYKELKDDIERCLDISMKRNCSGIVSEREELRGYMQSFMDDMKTTFPDNGLERAINKAKGE